MYKKDFYDDNLKFSKEDFADDEDEEDELFYEEKDHIFLRILLIIIALASIFTAAFFVLKEYTNIF